MKHLSIYATMIAMFVLSGCSMFGRFTDEMTVDDDAYGEGRLFTDEMAGSPVGEISWRDYFSDPKLQVLIDSALSRNIDVESAGVQTVQAESMLRIARFAFLPAISLAPSITIAPDEGYSLPLTGEFSTGGFGSLTGRKREMEALAAQANDIDADIRSRMVASIAKAYYQLQLLDREYEIIVTTEKLWGEVLETQKALMENGRSYSTSVNQMKASLLGVTMQKMDIENSIADLETDVCNLLRQYPQHIDRSAWNTFEMNQEITVGVPAQLLENRADVRAAGRALEAAFYVTSQARCSMLPGLSLSGMLGWGTNGAPVTNPAEFIYKAVASLAQPVFAQGRLRANLKISRMNQQLAADRYAQAVVNAGNEVNAALRACALARDKRALYEEQVSALQDAYSATQELMSNGKATYIEVLTAQEALLQAQLGEAANIYNGTDALISLYLSLGGGAE